MYHKQLKLSETKVLQFNGFHSNVGKTFAGLALSGICEYQPLYTINLLRGYHSITKPSRHPSLNVAIAMLFTLRCKLAGHLIYLLISACQISQSVVVHVPFMNYIRLGIYCKQQKLRERKVSRFLEIFNESQKFSR